MFESVLIANRGEIAVRINRTLRRLGVRSVAVFSDADAGARHVLEADVALRIGSAPPRDSYLNIPRVLDAAVAVGAQAIHPGYGFLAENAAFATACAEAGIVFIGPTPHAVEVMGDKIRAKNTVSRAGVPVVPGIAKPGLTDKDLIDSAGEVGYPVLIKPSAGGGGKGMHLVSEPAQLAQALTRARREAASAFGDDTLFLERFVVNPRHIEVQVLADTVGTTVHLGERECSLQRRHQKIIEEAPSVLLDGETRARIGESACSTARVVGYVGAGTVEFIVASDQPDEFFFMEMNTRLQVEHPVTEAVTGLDLVEQQLRIAAGETLAFSQADVRLEGHAIEARLYAEDPSRGFLPTGGTARLVREPHGEGVRVDSALIEGLQVGTDYDPMLAKVIAWAPDRATALARLDRALADTTLLGFTTNLAFLRSLLRHPDVQAGRLDTSIIDRDLEDLTARRPASEVFAAYGLLQLDRAWSEAANRSGDLWDLPSGWRLGTPKPLTSLVRATGGEAVSVSARGRPSAAMIRVGDGLELPARLMASGDRTVMELAGRTHPVHAFPDGSSWWLAVDDETWQISVVPADRRAFGLAATDTDILSPMPGTVLTVNLRSGDSVGTGQVVVVIEAMKMEHSLTASVSGKVEILVTPGQQVSLDQVVAQVTPAQPGDGNEERF